MEPYTLSIYGLSVLLNWKRPRIAMIAAVFFMIEYGHYLLAFKYYATQFFSIAFLTMLPVIVSRYAPQEIGDRVRASCLALMILYFVAWLTVEFGLDNSGFFWVHLAILVYQFGVLNGGCGRLVDFFLALGAKLRARFYRFNH